MLMQRVYAPHFAVRKPLYKQTIHHLFWRFQDKVSVNDFPCARRPHSGIHHRTAFSMYTETLKSLQCQLKGGPSIWRCPKPRSRGFKGCCMFMYMEVFERLSIP